MPITASATAWLGGDNRGARSTTLQRVVRDAVQPDPTRAVGALTPLVLTPLVDG